MASKKLFSSSKKTLNIRLGEDDLMCKNGCGFYGNPQWNGFCSKCYKDGHQRKEFVRPKTLNTNQPKSLPSRLDKDDLSPIPGFNKFQSKKKQQQSDRRSTGTKLLNVLISKSPAQSIVSPRSKLQKQPTENPDIAKVDEEFRPYFEEELSDPIIENDVKKEISARTFEVLEMVNEKNIVDVADYVQTSYEAFTNRMEKMPVYAQTNSKDREKLMDYFEKCLMTNLYGSVFCPASTDDEELDLKIQSRIRQLSWVCAKHLECGIDETNAEVRDLVYNAITDLLGLDAAKAPQDKLSAVVNCCRNIFLLLQKALQGPASADDFLPALIFVVLKANPSRFKSNVNFIVRFCNSSRLNTGEGGYYFTNLCCAMQFIEKLSAGDLSMSQEEFDQFVSGAIVLPNAWESAMMMCESLREMQEHLSTLAEIRVQQEALKEERRILRQNIFEFQDEVEREVDAILARTPLKFRKPAEIDAEDPVLQSLPPPIMPISAESLHPMTVESNSGTSLYKEFILPSQVDVQSTTTSGYLNQVKAEKKPINLDINLPNVGSEKSSDGMSVSAMSSQLTTKDSILGTSFSENFTDPGSVNIQSITTEELKYYDMFSNEVNESMKSVHFDVNIPGGSGESSHGDDVAYSLSQYAKDHSTESLLDGGDSPSGLALPSPLKPSISNSWDVPSIPCNTGEISSSANKGPK